jgi:hypothetical protein
VAAEQETAMTDTDEARRRRSEAARKGAATKGHDAAQARELVRTVERRLAMLRERRQIAQATEGPGGSGEGRYT